MRKIGIADLREVLALGWNDFLTIPTQLAFLCILYPIVGLVAARAAVGQDLVPLLYPLVAGIALLGPVLAVGIYELSRRREARLAVSWLNAFDILRSPAIFSIAVVGLMLLALFTVWMSVAETIYERTVGPMHPGSVGQFAQAVLHSPDGWQLIVWGNLAGLAFAVIVLALTVVSIPMMLDRTETSPAISVATSIRAVLVNPAVLGLWGLIVAAVLVLGCLPLFIGLAVAMPVLGHATWHLYRRVVA
ncbi:MAG TPA: DUF2189 domain-containing protein [Stellaceae bacterium]|nr:DUF2189 domain-containing protein [Stellaceae bacterium]